MGYVNESLVVGRLGADPELTYTKLGMAVCRMSIATHQKYMKGTQSITETEWHKAVVFGRRAEVAKEELSKGDTVYVKGVKRTAVFKDKSGQQRQKVEIIALDIKWEGSEEFDFTAPQEGGKNLTQQNQANQRMSSNKQSPGSQAGAGGTKATKPKSLAEEAGKSGYSDDQIEKELADLRHSETSP